MKRLTLAIAGLLLALTASVPHAAATPAPTADPLRVPAVRTGSTGSCAATKPPTRRSSTVTPHSGWRSPPTTTRSRSSVGFGGLGDAGLAERRPALPTRGRPRSARAAPDVDFDYLVKDVRGRLAYTVAIERANVLYAGHVRRSHRSCGSR